MGLVLLRSGHSNCCCRYNIAVRSAGSNNSRSGSYTFYNSIGVNGCDAGFVGTPGHCLIVRVRWSESGS